MKKHNIPVFFHLFCSCPSWRDVRRMSRQPLCPARGLVPRQLGSRLPDPGNAYSFDETEFLNLYNRALEQRKMGEKPSSPTPQDPSETGFGVLPLDRETYGTSACVSAAAGAGAHGGGNAAACLGNGRAFRGRAAEAGAREDRRPFRRRRAMRPCCRTVPFMRRNADGCSFWNLRIYTMDVGLPRTQTVPFSWSVCRKTKNLQSFP